MGNYIVLKILIACPKKYKCHTLTWNDTANLLQWVVTKLVWRGGEPSQCITSHGLPPSACSCGFKKPGFFCVTIYSKSNEQKQSSWSAFRLPSSTPLFGSWKIPHLCPSVDTQVLVSSMWVPPTWVGNPSRMLGCSDGLKSMPPARCNGGCWKGVFFFFVL